MHPPAHRGFTLVEMLTVMAASAILIGLSVVALTKLRARGNYSTATGEFVATLRMARAEAYGRGDNTAVIIDTQGGRWCALEDVDGGFAASGWPPASYATWCPPPSPARLIASGTLPNDTSFGPQGGFGQALPPPFSGIPTGYTNIVLADGGSGGTADISVDGGGAAPLLKYCSFCDPATGLGAVTFLPSGGAVFSGGPQAVGGQVSLQNASTAADGGTSGLVSEVIDFAIIGATGSVEAVHVLGH
jgi:prepilin-type N-terminal cleavage/methylation domain-containing protein